ncbi:hypothetical protein [Mycobacterium paraense]|nr:hypothetical protein [Mycobacterium paraense]
MMRRRRRRAAGINCIPTSVKRVVLEDFLKSMEMAGMSTSNGIVGALRANAEAYLTLGHIPPVWSRPVRSLDGVLDEYNGPGVIRSRDELDLL